MFSPFVKIEFDTFQKRLKVLHWLRLCSLDWCCWTHSRGWSLLSWICIRTGDQAHLCSKWFPWCWFPMPTCRFCINFVLPCWEPATGQVTCSHSSLSSIKTDRMSSAVWTDRNQPKRPEAVHLLCSTASCQALHPYATLSSCAWHADPSHIAKPHWQRI